MSQPLFETIKFDRHAIINASAGTGKTYTIQNLYVRLLLELKLNPSQILVLTFTEKATAELREKIRGQIADALKSQPENSILLSALNAFDGAQIFTIHGFCQRVLAQFAFENGEPFSVNLSEDDWLYEAVLRDLMREKWPELFGAALPGLLMYAGYPDRGEWESKVVRLAKQIRARPSPSDRVVPDAPSVESILAAQEKVREIFKHLSTAAGVGGAGTESRAVAQFDKLKNEKVLNGKVSTANVRAALSGAIAQSVAEDGAPDLLNAALACVGKEDYIEKIAIPNKNKDGELAACKELSQSADLVRKLRDAAKLAEHALTVFAAWNVSAAADLRKRQEGLASFDDLLVRLRDALDESVAPQAAKELARVLRDRFRVAIVDEAQDTDRVQWDILRRIFADADAKAQRLFAVGDPKQAIYGFRGADVSAYVAACDALGPSAEEYSLGDSWRSTAPLVRALNTVFENGYFDAQSRFAYTPVRAVPDAQRKLNVVSDTLHGGAPLVLYALADAAENESIASRSLKQRLAHFVSSEIARLLDGAVTLSIRGVQRALQPGDICVLVRGKKEAAPIEAALAALGIPHSYYKKAGLYQSDEALELSYVLNALARPHVGAAFKRALLTSFFRVKLEELSRMGDAPPEHRSRMLLARWIKLAGDRQWSRLFRALLDDTGVLLAHSRDSNSDIERRQMNFLHLLEELENTARKQHLDLVGLCEHLRRCRFESIALENDADIQRIESERSKVQIMTMHVSKGLEFPVVFVAGGLSPQRNNSVLKYHDNGASVYDLIGDEPVQERAQREQDEEEKRLYYVALTRAQAKCYVPFLSAGNSKKPLNLPRLLGPRLNVVAERNDPGLACVVPWNFEPKTKSSKKEDPLPETKWILRTDVPLKDILSQKIPGSYERRVRVHKSYSALKRAKRTFGEQRVALKEDEASAVQPALIDAPDFPAGAEAGTVLHSLFEHVDFETVMACKSGAELAVKPAFQRLCENDEAQMLLKGSENWLLAAAEMVWRTLHASRAGFQLGSLKKSDRLSELEFTFPLPASEGSQEGYLNGFIDLVYRREVNGIQKYFVLDWKSDVLPAYDADALMRHMEAMEYTLQYKVYALAMARWLKQNALDPRTSFGGLEYIFLRGVGRGNGEGVYVAEAPADLSVWEREIFARLNEPLWTAMEERGG